MVSVVVPGDGALRHLSAARDEHGCAGVRPAVQHLHQGALHGCAHEGGWHPGAGDGDGSHRGRLDLTATFPARASRGSATRCSPTACRASRRSRPTRSLGTDVPMIMPDNCGDPDTLPAARHGRERRLLRRPLQGLRQVFPDDPDVRSSPTTPGHGGGEARCRRHRLSRGGFGTIMNIHDLLDGMDPASLTHQSVLAAFKATTDQPSFLNVPYSCSAPPLPNFAGICAGSAYLVQQVDGTIQTPSDYVAMDEPGARRRADRRTRRSPRGSGCRPTSCSSSSASAPGGVRDPGPRPGARVPELGCHQLRSGRDRDVHRVHVHRAPKTVAMLPCRPALPTADLQRRNRYSSPLLIALVYAAGLGLLIFLLVFRPLRNSPPLVARRVGRPHDRRAGNGRHQPGRQRLQHLRPDRGLDPSE